MISSKSFHSLYAIRNRRFRCVRCRHETDLVGAIAHAIEQQLDLTTFIDRPLGAP